jgi:type I restriction enzyme S subunit
LNNNLSSPSVKMVRLGDIAHITYGKGLPVKNLSEAGYPVFGANGIIGFHSEYMYEEQQVLISCRGAASGTINMSPENCFITNNSLIINFNDDENICKKAFFYLLKAASKKDLVTGSAQPQVTINNAIELKVPLFSYSIQESIVAKIEELFSELDSGIAALKTAREQLKVYRQAILKHAFEGRLTAQWRKENKDKLETPEQLLARIQHEREARYQQQLEEWKQAVKEWEANGKEAQKPSRPRKLENYESVSQGVLPNSWTWLSVGNLNVDVFDGPFGSNLKTSDYVGSGVRVIRLENIGHSKFIEEKHSYITEEKYNALRKHTVGSGDVIFSSFITDGIRLALLPKSIGMAINKADCFCIRVHGQSNRNDYLAAYLSSHSAYKQIEDEIHGVGRPRINTTQLKNFIIPICGRDEQDEIMKKIESALSLSDHLQLSLDQELDRIGAFRQSILKKAFSGQLVMPSLSDKYAGELLARIQKENSKKNNTKKIRKDK